MSKHMGHMINTNFCVADLTGLTTSTFGKEGRRVVAKLSKMGAGNFPEVLDKMYIVNAPWIFTAIWGVMKHFVAERTRNKISIFGVSATTTALAEHLELD